MLRLVASSIKNFKYIFLIYLILCSNAEATNKEVGVEVSASVNPFCTVDGSDLAFGIYRLVKLDTNSSMSVRCTKGTNYSIGLTTQPDGGATSSIRNLTNGQHYLPYTLYQDVTRSKIWGDASNDMVSSVGTGVKQTYNIYASMPANQSIPAGSYEDELYISIIIGNQILPYEISIAVSVSAEVAARVESKEFKDNGAVKAQE